jgi:hypothetical protein
MITRRDFSRAMGLAAIAATSAAGCSSPPAAPSTSTGRTSFPALKQVDAGLLDVGYAEDGPGDGTPVICCTAGRTTSTATSTWGRCWRRTATE